MEGTALILARLCVYSALLVAAGVPAALAIARETGGRWLPAGAMTAAVLATLWWALESIAAMAALPLGELDRELVTSVLAATPLGTVIAIRLAALCAALVALWFRRNFLTALFAASALASVAWTGHAGASEGHLGFLHCASDIVHVLAAAVWTGSLVLFLIAAVGGVDNPALARRLARFSGTGTLVVLLLLVSGIANSWVITNGTFDPAMPWFQLLLAKIALFGLMLGLAACNRWRLTPALASAQPCSLRNLRISLGLETGAAFVIVALVAALGTLSPA